MINHTVAIQMFPICTLSPGLLIFPFIYIEQDPPSKHQLVFFFCKNGFRLVVGKYFPQRALR